MRIEEAGALISPIIPLQRAGDAAEADWMRSFALARLGVLAVAFSVLPIALVVAPQTSAGNLSVFLTCVISATCGIVGLMYVSPLAGLVAAFVGNGVLAAGHWFGGFEMSAAVLAIFGLVCDFVAMPKAFQARRWLKPLLTFIAGALLVGWVWAEPASGIDVSFSAILLPLAPLMTLVFCNTSTRQRLEAALKAGQNASKRDEMIVAAADVAVLVCDRGGHILDATETSEAILGSPSSSMMGRGLIDRVLIVDRPAFLRAVSDVINGAVSAQLMVRMAVGDTRRENAGPPRFAEFDLSIRTVPGAVDGATIRIARAAPQQTIAVDRAPLLQALAHEIRTPMNAILGFSEILADPDLAPGRNGQVADYARIIHRSAREAFSVTKALIDLMRIEDASFVPEAETVNVHEMLGSISAGILERLSATVVGITMSGGQGNTEIEVDPRLCRMMFSTMLESFVAALPQPVQIVCSVAGNHSDVTVEIVCRPVENTELHAVAQGGAHFGVVEALCLQIARLSCADFKLEASPTHARAAIKFQKAVAPRLPVTQLKTVASVSPLPLRKSA